MHRLKKKELEMTWGSHNAFSVTGSLEQNVISSSLEIFSSPQGDKLSYQGAAHINTHGHKDLSFTLQYIFN